MKSSIRCTPTRTSRCGSITNCAIGNTPTTACAPTSRSPTSLHWNSSPVGNSFGERPSVTNLLDEYSNFQTHLECATLEDCAIDRSGRCVPGQGTYGRKSPISGHRRPPQRGQVHALQPFDRHAPLHCHQRVGHHARP